MSRVICNENAERMALAGAIDGMAIESMADVDRLVGQLTEEHFVNPKNVLVFRAIVELKKADRLPCDWVALDAHLKTMPALPWDKGNASDYVGGVTFITTMSVISLDAGVSSVPLIYESYLQILQEVCTRRKLAEAGDRLLRASERADIQVTGTAAIGQIEAALSGLKRSGDSGSGTLAEAIIETVQDIRAAQQSGYSGFHTGIPFFDQAIVGLPRGKLSGLGAFPGCGKTAFALQTLVFNAMSNNRALLWSIEMSKRELGSRYASTFTGYDQGAQAHGHIPDWELDALLDHAVRTEALSTHFRIERCLDQAIPTIEHIVERTHQLISEGFVPDIIAVDYIGLIWSKYFRSEGRREHGLNMKICSELRKLAEATNAHCMVLSQLNKKNLVGAKFVKPNVNDAFRDGGILDGVDQAYLFWRDIDANPVSEEDAYTLSEEDRGAIGFEIGKNRVGKTPASGKLYFDGQRQQFRNYRSEGPAPEY
jgi:replicative DNA helicase